MAANDSYNGGRSCYMPCWILEDCIASDGRTLIRCDVSTVANIKTNQLTSSPHICCALLGLPKRIYLTRLMFQHENIVSRDDIPPSVTCRQTQLERRDDHTIKHPRTKGTTFCTQEGHPHATVSTVSARYLLDAFSRYLLYIIILHKGVFGGTT